MAAAGDGQKPEHIVVLMMENRSYDHVLFSGEHQSGSELPFNLDEKGQAVSLQVRQGRDEEEPEDWDPPHEHEFVWEQLYGPHGGSSADVPTQSGYVTSAYRAFKAQGMTEERAHELARKSMEVLSVDNPTAQLVRRYPNTDHWFCDVPSGTWPNRCFAQFCTSRGQLATPDFQKESNALILSYFTSFFGIRSLFSDLSDRKVSWRIYYHMFPISGLYMLKEYFLSWLFTRPAWKKAQPLILALLEKLDLGWDLDYLLEPKFLPYSQFEEDCRSGQLPAYSFIEPNYMDKKGPSGELVSPRNDQHPPSLMQPGDDLIQTTISAVEKTPKPGLLLVVYDEHGGLFDHVPPPAAVSPDGIHNTASGFDFKRYGPRVPAFVVPFNSPSGRIFPPFPASSPCYSHCSIASTVRLLFMPHSSPLTDREKAAPPFWLPNDTSSSSTPDSSSSTCSSASSEKWSRRDSTEVTPPDIVVADLQAKLTEVMAQLQENLSKLKDEFEARLQALDLPQAFADPKNYRNEHLEQLLKDIHKALTNPALFQILQ